MTIPLQIVYHHVKPSDALETKVQHYAERLARLEVRILDCRVTLEQENHRHRKGNRFNVRVELRVPGKEFVATHAPSADNEDAYVALHHAFDVIERQLKEHRDTQQAARHYARQVH